MFVIVIYHINMLIFYRKSFQRLLHDVRLNPFNFLFIEDFEVFIKSPSDVKRIIKVSYIMKKSIDAKRLQSISVSIF